MHYINEILECSLKKSIVIIDDDIRLHLYKGEIREFKLKGDSYIEDIIFNNIIETLGKRALKYSVHLLKGKDYSIAQLINKLKLKGYSKDSIEYATDILIDKGYLNDESFAENYYEIKKQSFGVLRIKSDLYRYGISKEIIDRVLEDDTDRVNVDELIQYYADRKCFDKENADRKEKERFYRFLVRKGIDFDSISNYFS